MDPVLYPPQEVIDRCALEHDWGQDTDKLLAMWSRVKGDNASYFTYILIALVLVAIAVAAIVSRRRKAARRRHRR